MKKNQTIRTKSSYGGRRKGAGRKPGGVSVATRAKKQLQASILAKAVESGHTPLQVMIETMNEYVAAAHALGEQRLVVNERVVTRLNLLRTAADIAKDAAPYCHAKLATIEHTGEDDGPIEHHLIVELVE